MNPSAASFAGSSERAPLSVEIDVVERGGNERPAKRRPSVLTLREVLRSERVGGMESLTFVTDHGDFAARYHPVSKRKGRPWQAVVFVGGSGGGLDGPARGLYPATCERLQKQGLAGLRIDYRVPNDLPACILDTLLAVAFLQAEGVERVALVGHSFGGAVVISAGALSTEVTAVVPMSTQTYGADLVAQVSPRPLLIIHGTADEVLAPQCSELVYAAAREPKELKLFAGARHGLDHVREELIELLVEWLERNT